MNVLFFCHSDFASNSMGHIAGFAAGLRECGHACAAAIPGDDRSSEAAFGGVLPFRAMLFCDTWERTRELFPDGTGADIIHAWTPREHVRRAVERCRQEMPGAKILVHLEDNEEYIAACFLQENMTRLRELDDAELAARLPVYLSHPRGYRRFLDGADGVTGIVDRLADFAQPGAPFLTLWPSVDFEVYHPGAPDPGLRAQLGIRPEEKIVCYTGNSHFANEWEMRSLYEAIFLLNHRGVPCRLIRTGLDTADFPLRVHRKDLAAHVLHLGFVEKSRLPGLLRLADALVQPGTEDAFNRYRLPSKLPEFLACGRPVVLPRANLGLRVQADSEALVLETGAPEEIAAACRRVFNDPGLAQRLGANGAEFARRHFDPAASARGLARFYERLCSPWRALCERALERGLEGPLKRAASAARRSLHPASCGPNHTPRRWWDYG